MAFLRPVLESCSSCNCSGRCDFGSAPKVLHMVTELATAQPSQCKAQDIVFRVKALRQKCLLEQQLTYMLVGPWNCPPGWYHIHCSSGSLTPLPNPAVSTEWKGLCLSSLLDQVRPVHTIPSNDLISTLLALGTCTSSLSTRYHLLRPQTPFP